MLKIGKTVSTRKMDLTRILDHFNIQVENPVAILNQETSKNFLCSKNPADVYKVSVYVFVLLLNTIYPCPAYPVMQSGLFPILCNNPISPIYEE